MGVKELARQYRLKAAQLKQTVQKKYWDNSRGLFADTEKKDLYSQHANALAILSGQVIGQQAKALAKKMLADTTLAPASIYFKYYLHQAGIKAGLGNDYLNWLDKWRENITMGLTTWAEMSNVSRSRSDCHAWGSSPNIEFFRTVLGIDSDSPGFKQVKIEPHLGSLKNVSGEMPHPMGTIRVQYREKNGGTEAEVFLPQKTTGKLVWKSVNYLLKEGKNNIKLKK
jgi:alpha-L-rhamnosidase